MKLCIHCRHFAEGFCKRTRRLSPVTGSITNGSLAAVERCDSWLASKFLGTCGETGRHFEYKLSVIKP